MADTDMLYRNWKSVNLFCHSLASCGYNLFDMG
jgi:hypothetical protein